jgi:DNA repair exonuclease SbcCD nuclease subunit
MKASTFTLRGIVSSDWHLGSMKTVLGASATAIMIAEVEKVYAYAVTQGIEHVFVPGDLFDCPALEAETLIAILTLLIRYQDSGVKTYYLAGNHDFSETGKTSLDVLLTLTASKLVKNLHVYTTPEVVPIDGVKVAFLPYPCVKSLTLTAATESKYGHLNFAHVDKSGALNDLGREMQVASTHNYQHGSNDFTFSIKTSPM